jgi:YHS domain-containing protein
LKKRRKIAMAKDPVCGMEVDEKKAGGRSTYNGETYYFCGKGCKKAFDELPEKYVGDTGSAPDTIT